MIAITHGTMTRRRLSSRFYFRARRSALGALLLLVAAPRPHHAQTLSRLRGVVITVDSTPLSDATVALMGTDLAAVTDANGRFRIASVHPGIHLIQVRRIGYESVISRLDVGAGETLTVPQRCRRSCAASTAASNAAADTS